MARQRAGARSRRGSPLTVPTPSVAQVARYFDALYVALAASETHAAIGGEALGDAYAGQLGYAGEHELLRLAEAAGMAPGRRVVDLGCGTGGVAAWWSRRTGAAVLGVDCSAAGLRIGAAGSRDAGAALAVADANALPFAASSLDGIVSLDGFGLDFAALARQARRLLRGGGRLALLVSLPAGAAASALDDLAAAGLIEGFVEDQTEPATALMSRWREAYDRAASRHIAEVGERVHRGLVVEIDGLIVGYREGSKERALIVATQPEGASEGATPPQYT
ncbi:MAG: class I SAM-dependent methyltransferase [Dehalococcoidia bacterium]